MQSGQPPHNGDALRDHGGLERLAALYQVDAVGVQRLDELFRFDHHALFK